RKTPKVNGEDPIELFEQSPERVDAFENWYEKKRTWERSEQPLRDALNVFLELFDLYGKFERESETLQLFVVDGIPLMNHVEALDSYSEKLPSLERLPEALLRLVGKEEGAPKQAAQSAEPPVIDLLLTKHANPEQRRVIEELETRDTVMVQGPPGTGKTHTIANLIGHLLAKRQRILVTSHASKALRVVKEHVAPSLRPLCVSVLHGDDDSSKE